MKSEKEIWPEGRAPGKEEIERMYRIAYCVDATFFRKEDVIDLGLDLYRLKEFGEARMSKGLPILRKKIASLWSRMTDEQRSAYVMSDVMSGLRYVDLAIKELEKYLGEVPGAHEGVSLVQDNIFSRIPASLRERTERGFGKWKSAR